MANSNYYYDQYKSYKSQASEYEKNIKELNKIKNSLTAEFYDEQSNVNGELDDLREDLNKAVRHDSRFSSIANGCESYKERSTTADGRLNQAVIALENEIAALNSKKATAEQNRDNQYQSYNSAKQEERQARMNAWKSPGR